jgi:hypothetical protein
MKYYAKRFSIPPYRHPLCADIDCNDPDRLDRVRRHSRAPKLVDLSDRSPADLSLSCEPGAICDPKRSRILQKAPGNDPED